MKIPIFNFKKADPPKFIMKSIPIVGMITTFGFLASVLSDPNTFKVTDRRTHETEKREKQRGLLVSILSSLILNLVGIIMVRNGVPEGYIVLNFGFILGPVIGYMCDIGIGTEDGLKKTMKGKGVKYVLGSLATPMFFRYIITVFLDMFISNPIQDAIKFSLAGLRSRIQTNNKNVYGKLIKDNFPSILQSMVGILTFQAYTNDTRFRWAYARSDNANKISNDVIMLATALSAALFCVYNIQGAEEPGRRLMFACVAILLLSAGTMITFKKKRDTIDDPQGNPEGKVVTTLDADTEDMDMSDDSRAVLGAGMFAFFIIIGLVIPFAKGRKMNAV